MATEPDNGYIDQVIWWIENRNDTSFDFTQPYIKKSLRYVYPIFMFLYAVVGLVGLVGNISLLTLMCKRRLYKDPTFFFLGNIAFSDLIKCVFVLPISLANMLVQNWVFGSFLCFFLPMMQFFPIHASMLTFLMIAIDRYRLIVNPFKSRAPVGLCVIAAWVGAVCVVLPHAVYIKYIDLGALFGVKFNGVGICYVNMERHIEEYFRAIFVTLYALPLAIIGFLFVKVSAELKSNETTPTVVHYRLSSGNSNAQDSRTEDSVPKVTWANDSERRHLESETPRNKEYTERATQDSDDDLDITKEKRTQNYLIAMVTIFAICWCPMNILILVHYFIHETAEDVSGHFDITFITFAWFGYLSTCVNPVLFGSWCMPSATKDRLRGYFRFSNTNRRRSSSQISRTEISESFVLPATPSPRPPRKTGQSTTHSPRVHRKRTPPSKRLTSNRTLELSPHYGVTV